MFAIGTPVNGPEGRIYTISKQLKNEPYEQEYELRGPRDNMILRVCQSEDTPGWQTMCVQKREKLSILQRVLHLKVGDKYKDTKIGNPVYIGQTTEEYKFGDSTLRIIDNDFECYIQDGGRVYPPHPDYTEFRVKLKEALTPCEDMRSEVHRKYIEETRAIEEEMRRVKQVLDDVYEIEVAAKACM
jgi:hypothetical protein